MSQQRAMNQQKPMTRWNDFNDATDQGSYDVIPSGTLVKVRYDPQAWRLRQS